jgi:putative ABC transport system permease protein
MRLGNAVGLAIREISRNIMRTVLTTLGIVIGVAAVIAMVSLGEGATSQVTGEIASLGHNMLIVAPGSEKRRGRMSGGELFEIADADAIEEQISGVAGVAAVGSRPALVVYGNNNWQTNLFGTGNAYFGVRDWPIERGRMFDVSELRAGRPVCIIGTTVVEELYRFQEPLGTSIRTGNLTCTVIGVLESRGQSNFGDDQDDVVIMPLTTFHRRLAGNQHVTMIFLSAKTAALTGKVQRDVKALLRERRHIPDGQENNFQVNDLKEVAGVIEEATGILTAFLAAIAGISLLVGGIGIMNIMLVSVTERTQEIGTRLAIGAMERDVLTQFLVEAMVLSSLGGILGVALGLACSAIIGGYLNVPFIFSPSIIIIAVSFSCLVGIIFGFVPARRAARLNPIDALRHE